MEKFRSKILACFLAVALVVLTTPIGLNFDTQNNSVEIQSNKAHAVVPVAGAAAAFLAEVAAASGLTVSELIATVVGISAVGTGMVIATDAGINYGDSASNNLSNLIDAADYPAWDTLSSDSQQAWGSKENYDSAKFNSLLDAFGLGDARDRFYSSSGGNIDYTESETARLQQLGSIGSNWINNAGNSIGDIVSSFSNGGQAYIIDSFTLDSKVVNGSDYQGWPSNAPATLLVTVSSQMIEITGYTSNNVNYHKAMVAESNQPVYWIPYNTLNSSNQKSTRFWVFSKGSFEYAYGSKNSNGNDIQMPTLSNYRSAVQSTYNGQNYYWAQINTGNSYANLERRNFDTNGVFSSSQENAISSAIPLILFGEDLGIGSAPALITGYPEQLDDDEQVYYPDGGYNQNVTWANITTEPESNPGTGGTADLTEIIELLQRFHFTVDYNLLVQDNPLRSAVMELVNGMNKFKFYTTGQLKVHDEGVFDAVGDLGTYLGGLLTQIQATLSGFFVTDTATDVIGDLDFPDLGDKAVDLVDTISTLAPFGAMFLISELVAILSQVGKIQTPSMVFDFNFMPEHEYDLTVDLSWLDDAKPIINIACIVTLIMALAGTTARLIELEAAA